MGRPVAALPLESLMEWAHSRSGFGLGSGGGDHRAAEGPGFGLVLQGETAQSR